MASWRCAAWASWVRLEQQSIILSLAGRTTYSSGSSGLELHDTGVNMPGVKEKYTMTRFLGGVLLVATCFSPTYGQAKSQASGTADAIKQLERDWVNAQKAGDVAKLGQILADDWMGLGFDGTKTTKKQSLDNIKSGANKLESFEIGPMDVQVIGTTAIVQGSDTEKSSFKR